MRCWSSFSGKTSQTQRDNQNDLISMQKTAWRYLQMLNERDILMAHSLITIKNNLETLAIKEEETREFQIEQKRRRKEEKREEEILKSCNYYLKFGIIAGSIFVIYTVLFIIYYPPTQNLRSFIDMLFTFCSPILLFSIIAMIIDIRLRNRILRRYNQR